nr:transposase [Fervidicella metallireducens]
MLSSLIVMHIFNILTTSLLCIFLSLSADVRKFCQLDSKIPDETFFSRFKTSFENQIAELFNSITLKVIEICDKIDENLPKNSPYKGHNTKLIYDTSGKMGTFNNFSVYTRHLLHYLILLSPLL